jgi:protein-arginine kinase activator protein McsA
VLAGVQFFTNTLTGFRYTITNTAVGARYTNQLRESLASLQDHHTSGNFTTNYNTQINVCAQCHNDRGASYMDSESPPHHSSQYNMLLGTVGELASGVPPNLPATHSRIEKQCVGCHMQTSDQQSGHRFAVTSYEACVTCHGSAANAENFVVFLKAIITSLSQQVKDELDQWATNNAPVELHKYGALAWEYQRAGQLSSPDSTLSGPVSDRSDPAKDEQKYIPANIKKARFNLYLVINDGSYGVHNGPYAIVLLDAAQTWIQAESSK